MSQFYSLFRKNLFPVFYTVNTASIDKRKTSRFLEFCPLSGDMFFLHKKIKWTLPLISDIHRIFSLLNFQTCHIFGRICFFLKVGSGSVGKSNGSTTLSQIINFVHLARLRKNSVIPREMLIVFGLNYFILS